MPIQQMFLGLGGVSYYDAELYTWGLNDFGQLGVNDRTNRSSPVQVAGTIWGSVGRSENSYHVVVTQQDGTLWTWGRGDSGRLGHNNRTSYSSPVQVPGSWAVGYNKCIAHHRSSMAIKQDGTLWGWGGGGQGILGNNATTQYSSPIQIPGTTWAFITGTGSATTCAVKTDGTMWTWGTKESGNLGTNSNVSVSSPIQVPGTTWTGNISGGRRHFAAIKNDNTLWMWGSGYSGTMGQSNRSNYSSPKQVPGTNWSKVACGYDMTVATKTDGTIWSWGMNEDGGGYLGQNNFGPSYNLSSPEQIGSATDWNYDGGDNAANSYPVFASMNNAGGVRSGGTLWIWGRNYFGENAQNDRFPGYYAGRSSPVQIPGTKWLSIAGGETNFYAIKDIS